MSPRAFGYVMVAGFVAWLVSTLTYISLQPDEANYVRFTVAVLVVPVVVMKIAALVFRNH